LKKIEALRAKFDARRLLDAHMLKFIAVVCYESAKESLRLLEG